MNEKYVHNIELHNYLIPEHCVKPSLFSPLYPITKFKHLSDSFSLYVIRTTSRVLLHDRWLKLNK